MERGPGFFDGIEHVVGVVVEGSVWFTEKSECVVCGVFDPFVAGVGRVFHV